MISETWFVLRPEKGKGKPGHFASSAKEWYSGWSCMTTLINKGLVVKSSCPAKYGFCFFISFYLFLPCADKELCRYLILFSCLRICKYL